VVNANYNLYVSNKWDWWGELKDEVWRVVLGLFKVEEEILGKTLDIIEMIKDIVSVILVDEVEHIIISWWYYGVSWGFEERVFRGKVYFLGSEDKSFYNSCFNFLTSSLALASKKSSNLLLFHNTVSLGMRCIFKYSFCLFTLPLIQSPSSLSFLSPLLVE